MILKWLRILTAEPKPDAVFVFLGEKSRFQCIRDLLVVLTSHPRTRSLLTEEEILGFVLDLWLRSDYEFKSECIAALTLSNCIFDGDNTIRRLSRIPGFHYKSFIDLVLYRIYMAADHILEEPRQVHMSVGLWHAIVDNNHGNNYAFEFDANGALLHILKRMRRVWKDGPGPEYSNQLADSCQSALDKNFNSFVGKEFMDAVKVALSSGILDVCLYLSTYAPLNSEGDEDSDFPLMFLRVYLPRLLVFPSCIRATKNAISAIKSSSLTSLSSGHPAYREAWLDLQRLLSHRLISSVYFDANKPYYSCSNVCAVLDMAFSIYLTVSCRCDARPPAPKTK